MAALTRLRDTVTMHWAMVGCGNKNSGERWRSDEKGLGKAEGSLSRKQGRGGGEDCQHW